MPKKSDLTREAILNAGMRLFMEKGFASVSMTDLCEATGLSRGGLYRYFGSTAAVFRAMLERDKDEWLGGMESAMQRGESAAGMLRYYLDRMLEGMARGEGRLSLAAYEYLRSPEAEPDFGRARFAAATGMYEALLRYGQQRGEFGAFDARMLAERNVVLLDGLRLASAIGLLSDESLRVQTDALMNEAIRKDENK